MSLHDRLEKLQGLYSELPKLECKGLCGGCCHDIGMTTLEAERLVKRGARGIEYWRPGLHWLGAKPCPMLRNGRCTAYDARPMICRLWGVDERMRCDWGCEPERVLTHEESLAFLERARAI